MDTLLTFKTRVTLTAIVTAPPLHVRRRLQRVRHEPDCGLDCPRSQRCKNDTAMCWAQDRDMLWPDRDGKDLHVFSDIGLHRAQAEYG